jgi:hypothetical protein
VSVVEARARAGRPLRATASVAVGVAALGSALLVWGRSFPGFPLTVALATLLCAAGAVLLAVRSRSRAGATTAVVVVTLGVGIAAAAALGDRPLEARWAASASGFEAYVAELPAPSSHAAGDDGASFRPLPSDASCPAQLGRLRLGACVSVDGGYLFLQAPDAVTDSSGIAYLPARSGTTTTQLDARDLTPLGGPWWSWTCHC